MNIVNRSSEMKNPNTPTESRQNHMKYSLGSGSMFQDVKMPVKTMKAESRIIRTEIPSTPTL